MDTVAAADPFAVFGDDSDDDDDDGSVHRSVVPKAVTSRIAVPTVVKDTGVSEEAATMPEESLPATSFSLLDLPWKPPLYMAPGIQVVSSLGQFGGQRGFLATERIAPGTLLLVETPVVAWSDYEIASDETVHDTLLDIFETHFLEHLNLPQLLEDLEYLHPTKAVVDSCMQSPPPPESIDLQEQVYDPMQELRQHYKHSDRIQQIIARLPPESQSVQDIFRILLALRYNGLETGLYLYAAMLNHADAPNCVKFRPSAHGYSEVRATRTIAPYQPLTISYVPRILSVASRRRYLWRQHRFDILRKDLAAEHMPWRAMERVGPVWPMSSWSSREDSSENSITSRMEADLAELESQYADVMMTEDVRDAQTLEQRCWEWFRTLQDALQNDQHILWIPARALHVNICSGILSHPAADRRSLFDRMALLQRLVISAEHLRDLQRQFHGPDHFDIAQTSLDLVQAAEELLSRSPHQLRDVWSGDHVSAWSARAFQIRSDYERIKALYPENVNDFIDAKKEY
jgi:SET domain